jgi:hypothetical protein
MKIPKAMEDAINNQIRKNWSRLISIWQWPRTSKIRTFRAFLPG